MKTQTRGIVKTLGVVGDANTVKKEAKNITLESASVTSGVLQDFGGAMEMAGVATGQGEVAAVGAIISSVGVGMDLGVRYLKDENVAGDVTYEVAKSVISDKISKPASDAVTSGTLSEQANNIYQAAVYGWGKMSDWVKDKYKEATATKK
jgi:hypothetical protein